METEELVDNDLQKDLVENKIIHNGQLVEDGVKSDFWQECGAAWENKKGGFNLVLPGMKLVMLPNKAKK